MRPGRHLTFLALTRQANVKFNKEKNGRPGRH